MSREPSVAELAAAEALHHQLFTGLLLGMAGHHGQGRAAELVERTFRRQHDERFVPGLERLGLSHLPHAVACARFICLSNRAGGLEVQIAEEHDRRAWVRYPPPRWAYEGPAVCALDDRVSEAFLRGFHARCGDSLGNPRLRFVCTGMTTHGDPGLTGCFEECETPVGAAGRLAIRLGEPAPRFDPHAAPALPWPASRAPLARRNYAVRYIAIMLPVLRAMLGEEEGTAFAARMARLVGLQGYRDTARRLGIERASRAGALEWLGAVHRGTGNVLAGDALGQGRIVLERFRLGTDPSTLRAWNALLEGGLAAHDDRLALVAEGDGAWRLR